ncbi:MAG: HdeD family acid-resistance protein [Bilifractor sp.]
MLFYDNDKDYRQEIRSFWNENVKRYRAAAICSGIIMLILGVIGIIWPVDSAVVVACIIAAALIVFGIAKIAGYVKTPAYFRSGLGLVDGILDILLGIMMFFSGTDVMLYTLSFFFAFELIVAGIENLVIGNRIQFFGFASNGNFVVSGVIDLIVGTLLLFMPGASLLTMAVMAICFLITKGILLIIDGVRAGKLEMKTGE